MENKNKEMCAKIEQNNKKMCEELKEILNTNVKVAYAEAVQKALPDPKKIIPLIVKPKEKQNVVKIKALNEKIDPEKLKIKNIENKWCNNY